MIRGRALTIASVSLFHGVGLAIGVLAVAALITVGVVLAVAALVGAIVVVLWRGQWGGGNQHQWILSERGNRGGSRGRHWGDVRS